MGSLFLIYEIQLRENFEAFSILKAGDLKVKTETISGLTNSIASGNEKDRESLKIEILEFDSIMDALFAGGKINGQTIETIPSTLDQSYKDVTQSWKKYREVAENIRQEPVFDQSAVESLNYVLENNGELLLQTDLLVKDLEGLDRNYNKHKEISIEIHELAKSIGQKALLISIGEQGDLQDQLKNERVLLDEGIGKLLETSQVSFGNTQEEFEILLALPKENSEALRRLDPLWEAVSLRVKVLEEKTIVSSEFENSQKGLQLQRGVLLLSIDEFLEGWNDELNKGVLQQQILIQILLGVDIVVFVAVFFLIRQSLNPLRIITQGLLKIKRGIYGEKIIYHSSDEVGDLINTFNKMSETIRRKQEEGKKIDQTKDEFLAMITHELKTPLVPIQGYVDILLGEHMGKLSEEQKERLKIIKSNSQNLLEIISDILDAQKLELGRLRIRKESLNVNETISKTRESLKPLIDKKEIQIKQSGPDTVIQHDSKRIGQVLNNLIRNSLNAVKRKTGTVEILTENLPSEIKLSVKDNGIGISPEKQKDLFKKFYQVDTSLTRENGGSGLGLAICKGIIEAHGGKIKFESFAESGTVFSFTLPKTSKQIENTLEIS